MTVLTCRAHGLRIELTAQLLQDPDVATAIKTIVACGESALVAQAAVTDLSLLEQWPRLDAGLPSMLGDRLVARLGQNVSITIPLTFSRHGYAPCINNSHAEGPCKSGTRSTRQSNFSI